MPPITDTFVELHVPDFQMAIDFYSILGFEVVWMQDGYLVMKKNQSIINFYQGDETVYNHSYFRQFSRDTKRGYAVEIIFLEDDIHTFYDSIKDQVHIIQPLKQKPGGKYDFRIEDPFGFYLRLSERYDWTEKPPQMIQ